MNLQSKKEFISQLKSKLEKHRDYYMFQDGTPVYLYNYVKEAEGNSI